MSADIKLETENETGSMEDIPSQLSPNTYHPQNALKLAIQDWLPEFYKAKNAFGRVINAPLVPTPIPACPLPVITGCFSTASMPAAPSTSGRAAGPDTDSSFQPLSNELVNSLITPKEAANMEPMDCNPVPPSPKHEEVVETSISLDNSPKCDEPADTVIKEDSAEEMQTEPVDATSQANGDGEGKQLSENDVRLLIDLFYLPFEHGKQGLKILQEFHWLKSHGHLVCQNPRKKSSANSDNPEVQEWFSRAAKFDAMTQEVGKMLIRLTFCPNRSLLYDLYPYVWDIKGVVSMLNSYVKWIGK